MPISGFKKLRKISIPPFQTWQQLISTLTFELKSRVYFLIFVTKFGC